VHRRGGIRRLARPRGAPAPARRRGMTAKKKKRELSNTEVGLARGVCVRGGRRCSFSWA
jgi:hypothetical protein